ATSWAPASSGVPVSRSATPGQYTKGGQTTTSQSGDAPRPATTASSSGAFASRLPFSFQLAATRGRRWRIGLPANVRRDPAGGSKKTAKVSPARTQNQRGGGTLTAAWAPWRPWLVTDACQYRYVGASFSCDHAFSRS